MQLQGRIENSVIRTGLLPRWFFAGKQRVRLDLSALGIDPPSARRQTTIGWIFPNSDGMIDGEVETLARVPTSLPVGEGESNRIAEFLEPYCDGFRDELTQIQEHRPQWIDERGLLSAFKGLRRRFLPRPTWFYLWLRSLQREPLSLSSDFAQRLALENLALKYLGDPDRPGTWRLLRHEQAQMEGLDVPFFDQPIDSADLRLLDGSIVSGLYELAGYDNARQKILRLDAASIEFQIQLIRGMVGAKTMRLRHTIEPDTASERPGPGWSGEDNLSEAEALAAALVGQAVYDSECAEWLGVEPAEDVETVRYGPVGPTLYGGRTGIALFLAYGAGAAAGDVRRRAALGACWDLRRLVSSGSPDELRRWWRERSLGLGGCGGMLLALLHLEDLLAETWEQTSRGLSPLVEALDVELIRADARLDIMLGCAGLIGPLLQLGTARALELAREAGDYLVHRQDRGGGWTIESIGPTPLTGFSHGAAGIVAALGRLHATTGDGRYLEAAENGLRYERATYDPAARNWPDLRPPLNPRTPRFMLSWCHGAPGIALSRMCLATTPLWNATVEADLNRALALTTMPDFGEDSLCCGRFGRAAILRLANRQGGERKWLDAAKRLEEQALDAKRRAGAFSFQDAPSLFTGAAGVGLALLESVGSGEHAILALSFRRDYMSLRPPSSVRRPTCRRCS